MKGPAGLLAAAVVLAGAAALVAVTPDDMNGPFVLTGGPGHPVTARLATVEVLDVQLTEHLEVPFDDVDGSTDGVWMVVDAVVTPALGRLSLSGTILRIGRLTFSASEILGSDSMLTQRYGAGISQRGPFVFELPRSALAGAGSATIVFETTSDPRLDSVPAVVVDLTALDLQDSVEVAEPSVQEAKS